ncbi:SRF-like protein [Dioscorea alata]|uniref:SRF-like protein n=1 Tax=Dioscorea alata TaxID=55571 RepID=A0ACB7UX39_DIOAL|nr:SRF-like protein [Dioscorea alata]
MGMENQPKMNITTRSKGLLKKSLELSTLCGIDVCLLFYDPSSSSSTAPALTFPSDPSQVSRILSRYQSHTGRVKDETPKYLRRQPSEPEIDLVDSPTEMVIDCAEETAEKVIDCPTEQWIDGEPIRALVDLVDEWVSEAERIGSGKKKGMRSFSRREKALRSIAEDLGVMLCSVNNRIWALLSRNMDQPQDFNSGSLIVRVM